MSPLQGFTSVPFLLTQGSASAGSRYMFSVVARQRLAWMVPTVDSWLEGGRRSAVGTAVNSPARRLASGQVLGSDRRQRILPPPPSAASRLARREAADGGGEQGYGGWPEPRIPSRLDAETPSWATHCRAYGTATIPSDARPGDVAVASEPRPAIHAKHIRRKVSPRTPFQRLPKPG